MKFVCYDACDKVCDHKEPHDGNDGCGLRKEGDCNGTSCIAIVESVETVEEALKLSKGKKVLFRYPEHATNGMLVGNNEMIEWMRACMTMPVVSNAWEITNVTLGMVEALVDTVKCLVDRIRWDDIWCEVSRSYGVDVTPNGNAYMNFAGVELKKDEGYNEVAIFELLEKKGWSVVNVVYGSELHHVWLGLVGD